ncbi:MAG: hypothetical protein JXO51_09880 [Candidatus Aminicenantes bacterium]|nr:hypothetical protein [Candidatus Aminicenantes bacterium]
MNATKCTMTMLILLLAAALSLPAAKSKPAPVTTPGQYFIAPQVAKVFDADAAGRTARADIPLSYLKTLHLPAQQNNVYPVFLFQVKNADLGFTAAADNPALLKASHMVFTRVYRLANGALGEIMKEHNIHFDLEEAQAAYRPEALNFYSLAGDIFPPGNYLLALALTTPDYGRIATAYAEFSLPDFSRLANELVTTPVFSVRSLQMMPAADSKMLVHKNSFVYNTLLLEPVLDNRFQASESLDLFYFILGARPDAGNAVSLQITYRFTQDGKEINKLAPQTVTSPIISQPIAFTFTEVTKDAKGKETERQEKLLEPGDYVLEIEMLDSVSQAKGRQEFKFTIVE